MQEPIEPAVAQSGIVGEPDMALRKIPRPRAVWVGALALAVGGAFGGLFLLGWKPQEQRQAALLLDAAQVKSDLPRVVVINGKRSPPTTALTLPGVVQAVRETMLYARTTGYLKRWLVDIGDNVKAGQLLAEIDSPEVDKQLEEDRATVQQTQATLAQSLATVEQDKAQLANAQATSALADLTMKRYDSLRDSHAVTEQDISTAETAAQVAHAAVAAAQAAIVAAQAAVNVARANIDVAKAEVQRLQVLQGFERITAPFDGTITARQAETGELLTAGSGASTQALFDLACADPLRVFVDVPQPYAPAVKIGQRVDLLVREFPNGKFSGEVARTTDAIDPASRTLRVEVHVPNPNGELLIGMYAQVKFSVGNVTLPLLLPGSALVINAGGTQVALVQDGHVHFQHIVVDGDYGANFGVSTGLAETDAVIANPSERLTEGLAVNVVEP